jgi:hypothetical protein
LRVPREEQLDSQTIPDNAAAGTGAAALATRYLTAFYTADFSTASSLVTDDFAFRGPFVEARDRDTFFASARGLATIVRGHRLLRQWADGDQVCSIFEMHLETPAGSGSIPVSEWHTVRDGRIAAAHVLFDSGAFRVLVPAS